MADLKIFTDDIEESAKNQINEITHNPAFENSKIRVMPDVHAGKGCVIGFTATLGDMVIPNVVGVDIGCGMTWTYLGKSEIDYADLDRYIRGNIPCGMNVHEESHDKSGINWIDKLYCKDQLKEIDRIERSIGTLGGGNHFIEVDQDDENGKYLVIHSGSRNLGKQVAEIYQEMAIKDTNDISPYRNELIERLKAGGRQRQISTALKQLKSLKELIAIPNDLCYLKGEHMKMYLHDMRICQRYATENRRTMTDIILNHLTNWGFAAVNETIHNYIGDDDIIRKGAVSAKAHERILIPLNMRDGCIIAVGLGNPDWNYSAPHGAGRAMSRRAAKENVPMAEYEKSMKGIYTTSVDESTLDECPMAYKPMNEILDNIKDTVEVEKVIKPVYNFKASENS